MKKIFNIKNFIIVFITSVFVYASITLINTLPKNKSAIQEHFSEPYITIPFTSAKGCNNKQLIDMFASLIQYDYTIYSNLCVGGHLPYNTSTSKKHNGDNYAEVSSHYFESVEEIKDYISLTKGVDLSDKQIKNYFLDLLHPHYVDALYKNINGKLFINLDEINRGRKFDKWSSFSFEIIDFKTKNSEDVYKIIINAIIEETKETEQFECEIFSRDGYYYIDSNITPSYIDISYNKWMADEVRLQELVEINDDAVIEEMHSLIMKETYCDIETYTEMYDGYLISGYKTVSIDKMYDIFNKCYTPNYTDNFVKLWFFEHEDRLGFRMPWSDPMNVDIRSMRTPTTTDIDVKYIDETRCEFIVESTSGTKKYKRYFIATKQGMNWRLIRHFGFDKAALLVE